MNYAASAAPLAGWDRLLAEKYGVRWTRAHRPGQGPGGRDAWEITELHDPLTYNQAGEWGGQHSWGWDGLIEPAPPPNGSTRYYRFRVRYSADSNFLSIAPRGDLASPRVSNMSNKLMIFGQGCSGGRCRVILTVQGERAGANNIQFSLQIDGGVDRVESGYIFPKDAWLNVQIELKSSSAGGVAPDGSYKLWVNNRDLARPDLSRTGIVLQSSTDNAVNGWHYVGFGDYNNNSLEPGGIHRWLNADFEVATAFDPAW